MNTQKMKMAAKLGALVAALSLFFSAFSFGAVTYRIKDTKHNLGSTGYSNWRATDTSEICIFCHTPHNSVAGKKWLWNRTLSGSSPTSFALYTSSPTISFKSGPYGVLSEVSKLCMSCHDGVTALNSMANPSPPPSGGGAINTAFGDSQYCGEENGCLPWSVNIGNGALWTGVNPGNDLTNDHPVSFSYSAAMNNDNTINDISVPKNAGLIFWTAAGGTTGDMVECVTCHDPHIKSNPKFLRRSNGSSNLCFACHNK